MRERSKSPSLPRLPPLSSSAVAMRCTSAALSHGLVIKSNAPALTPSTASGMLPHAVMSITGTSGRNTFTCRSSVRPSSPDVAREKFMSSITSCGAVDRTVSITSAGVATAFTS